MYDFHVKIAPTESYIRKCKSNIGADLRPIVVTIADSRAGIEPIAKELGVDGRIDVIEAEQFIATNILEWSQFDEKAQRIEVMHLISK